MTNQGLLRALALLLPLSACHEDDLAGAGIEIPADDVILTGDPTPVVPPRITSGPTKVTSETCTVCGGDCRAEQLDYDSWHHIPSGVALDYENAPPAGGDHDPCWAVWGVHDEVLEARHWVHNLEHGGVVFLYDCPAGCPDEIDTLEQLVASLPNWALLTRFPGLQRRFDVLSANHRLLMDCVDEAALTSFYETNKGHSTESITSGPPAQCLP